MASAAVIKAIDESPLNRGLSGVEWAADEANVAIEADTGIMLFDGEGDGVFQTHALLTVGGRQAIEAVKAAFATMFQDHGAELIFGLVPVFLPATKFVARRTGMKFAGVRQTANGPCELFVLSKDMWKGDDQ